MYPNGLNEDVENKLIVKAQTGDQKAMQTLIDTYNPAIKAAVAKVSMFMDADDALQEARITFMGMVHNHDCERGRLAGRVKTELTNSLREASTLASNAWSVPSRTQRRFLTIWRKADGNVSVGADMAEDEGMARDTFLKLVGLMMGTTSLDSAEYEYAESLNQPVFVDLETAALVEHAKAVLDQDQLAVVDRYYGFNTPNCQTDAEIAYELEIGSRSTITRLRHRAIHSMREAVAVYV